MQEVAERTYWILDKQVHQFGAYLRRISLPGFEKVPVYNVTSFFIEGLLKGSLSLRATSIAFNFLLALGPAVIFLLTLVPYIPVRDFKQELLEVMNEIIPTNSYIAIEGLINEIFKKRAGLQFFGFFVALFFSQKGISGLIKAFNATYHHVDIRSWYQQRFISMVLVAIMFLLFSLAIILLFISKMTIKNMVDAGMIEVNLTYYFIVTGRWIIITVLTFVSISFLYYLAPVRKSNWKFFSIGSVIATFLTLLASLGFSYFVNNFAPFDKIFGSIGALVALMLWMNFNAISLLAGFELNASIKNAKSDQVIDNSEAH